MASEGKVTGVGYGPDVEITEEMEQELAGMGKGDEDDDEEGDA